MTLGALSDGSVCPFCGPVCTQPGLHPTKFAFSDWADERPQPALDRYVVAREQVWENVTVPFKTTILRYNPGDHVPADEAARLGITGPVLLGPDGTPETPEEPEQDAQQEAAAPVETQDVPPPAKRDRIVERGPFVETQNVKAPKRGGKRR